MDILLISVTVMSLGMAAAMALFLMKLVRDERRRSDARVAVLTELASEDDGTGEREPRRPAVASVVRPARDAVVRDQPITRSTRGRERYDDLDLRPGAPVAVAGVGDLFTEPERTSPWGRRLLVVAAFGAIVFAAGYMLLNTGERATPAPTQAQRAASQAPAIEPASAAAPLELLSMRHAQEPDRLTVTGLVLNPRGAQPLTRAVATVFVFGADGTFLASGRAPLDFTTIAPGDESPFVVSVPVTGAIARYRVGFRAEDGTVIAHVDKRADSPSRAEGSPRASARLRE